MSRLPKRFMEPLAAGIMAELLAYVGLYDAEVRRVANVCAYWERNGLTNQKKGERHELR